MADPGDQVGTDNGPPPHPWERERWTRPRLAELGYSALSWPYLIALGLTVNYILGVWLATTSGPHALNLQAMLGSWTIAFVRREWANFMAQRQNAGGKDVG